MERLCYAKNTLERYSVYRGCLKGLLSGVLKSPFKGLLSSVDFQKLNCLLNMFWRNVLSLEDLKK